MIAYWVAESWMVPVIMIGSMMVGAGVAYIAERAWSTVKRWLS